MTRPRLDAIITRIENDQDRPPRPPHHGANMLLTAVQALRLIETDPSERRPASAIAADALARLERIAGMR